MGFDGPTIAMIAATVIGPIAAVQAQKWVERFRESRNEKRWVFAALMYTRGTRLSAEHVQALNRIELAFHKEPTVMAAWRAYLDSLGQSVTPEAQTYVWGERDKLFIDLLYQMSKLLKFPFTSTEIKNSTYSPIAHGEMEVMHLKVMTLLAKMADGTDGLPVRNWITQDQEGYQTTLMKFLIGLAEGTATLPVTVDCDPTPQTPTVGKAGDENRLS